MFMTRTGRPRVGLCRIFGVLLALGFGLLPAHSAASLNPRADSPRAPSLPPIEEGRTSPPDVIAKGDTALGQTELVSFLSTDGLCIEVDHIPQRARAGGCAFIPLRTRQVVMTVGQGFSSLAGPQGITEVFGQVIPQARSVTIEYRHQKAWRKHRVLLGRLSKPLQRAAPTMSPLWFAADLPGCLQGNMIRLRAFGQHHAYLGSNTGLPQDFACRSGNGYKIRGAVTYGALPLK